MAIASHLVVPSRKDVKAARNYMEWSQEGLGEMCGISGYTINSFEKERHKIKREQLDKLTLLFAEHGIKFNPNGGFRVEKDVVKIYEGRDAYIKVLHDILETCSKDKDEVLFLGNDDSRSTKEVNDIHKKIYQMGIPYKLLISNKNNYILGPLEDYRKIDEELFLSKDVILIYGNKVMFFIEREGDLEKYKLVKYKNLIINDAEMASTFRKYFFRLWSKAKKPTMSTAKQIFFKKK